MCIQEVTHSSLGVLLDILRHSQMTHRYAALPITAIYSEDIIDGSYRRDGDFLVL